VPAHARISIVVFRQIQQTVQRIPRGYVSTYGEVAKAAGYPGRARQVVWALHAGHGLPWHRVVGAGGKILLKNEIGLEQQIRLRTEGVLIRNGKVDLKTHAHVWKKRPKRPQRRKTS
jgi:methylated-DNA-protein-cysteine methyltransferase-like protein